MPKFTMKNKTRHVTIPVDIDFELLRKQKTHLVKLAAAYEGIRGDALEGIISLLDHIQDHAVDNLGISKKEVFGRLK